MPTAVITLSREGALVGRRLADGLGEADLYVHEAVNWTHDALRFSRVVDLTAQIFQSYSGLIFVAPCGVALRAVAPRLQSKTSDPAVVVVDVGGRYAISLLSGHEGGANRLALEAANIVSAEPVISTTTEALKTLIVGVGCRKGATAQSIVEAVASTLSDNSLSLDDVRLIASVDLKAHEAGLIAAAAELGVPLRFISSDEIRHAFRDFTRSEFVQSKVNLPAVAEPSALLAGKRTQLVVPTRKHVGVTVAVAKERCLWSE
jgi:cobalt-precorrin 5A hydrolase